MTLVTSKNKFRKFTTYRHSVKLKRAQDSYKKIGTKRGNRIQGWGRREGREVHTRLWYNKDYYKKIDTERDDGKQSEVRREGENMTENRDDGKQSEVRREGENMTENRERDSREDSAAHTITKRMIQNGTTENRAR